MGFIFDSPIESKFRYEVHPPSMVEPKSLEREYFHIVYRSGRHRTPNQYFMLSSGITMGEYAMYLLRKERN